MNLNNCKSGWKRRKKKSVKGSPRKKKTHLLFLRNTSQRIRERRGHNSSRRSLRRLSSIPRISRIAPPLWLLILLLLILLLLLVHPIPLLSIPIPSSTARVPLLLLPIRIPIRRRRRMRWRRRSQRTRGSSRQRRRWRY